MAINFYGGQPGRSFRIEHIFDTVKLEVGHINSLTYDLTNVNSDITLGSYVLVSYGQVESERYQECLATDNFNYNGSIWIKDYNIEGAKDSISVDGIDVKYWLLAQATGASAGFGDPTAEILDNGPGTPEVTITASGSDLKKVFNFEIKSFIPFNSSRQLMNWITSVVGR